MAVAGLKPSISMLHSLNTAGYGDKSEAWTNNPPVRASRSRTPGGSSGKAEFCMLPVL